VEQLESEVEFPDLRALVNDGAVGLKEILELRKKGQRFRSWLQDESERDRNALIAYHEEVAREAGMIQAGRKALRLFGFLVGSATGATIGAMKAGVPGAVLGAASGKALEYLFDLAAKMHENWRPVVFGKWMKQRLGKP